MLEKIDVIINAILNRQLQQLSMLRITLENNLDLDYKLIINNN